MKSNDAPFLISCCVWYRGPRMVREVTILHAFSMPIVAPPPLLHPSHPPTHPPGVVSSRPLCAQPLAVLGGKTGDLR
jgi:hypothetical protein